MHKLYINSNFEKMFALSTALGFALCAFRSFFFSLKLLI